jgi:hypothetical protein
MEINGEEKNMKNKKAEENIFRNLLLGFFLFALFGFLILTAVTQVGLTYDKNMTEVTGGALNLESYNNSITLLNEKAQQFHETTTKQNIWSAIAGVVVEDFFKTLNSLFNVMISAPFNLLSNVMIDVLHVPPVVTYVIYSIIILLVIFAIWRLIKIGD